jgi:oligopeptide transport system permease protein
MARLVLSRLLQLPLILAVVFVVTLLLAWVIPGNPLQRAEGRQPPEAVQEALQRQYNLHNPWAFAAGYLEGVLLDGDFGPSLRYRDQRVGGILAQALPVSVRLGALSLVVALLLGTVAGVVGALRPGSPLDLSSLAIALVGISLPSFVVGFVLLVLFVGLIPLFPLEYGSSPLALVLPAVTLGAMPAAYIARFMRLGLADVMATDYIRTARAKGLTRNQALLRHALKVASLPVLSFMGPAAAHIMTGSFVVEKVFNIPGLGEHFVQAVIDKDQFLILGVVLVFATMLICFNLVVDVAYAWVDPRISLDTD